MLRRHFSFHLTLVVADDRRHRPSYTPPMSRLAAAMLIALMLSVNGCILGPIAASQLSKEQMDTLKEYNDTGDLYACGIIGGPPPLGSVIFIVVPKGTPIDLVFPPSCPVTVRPK